MITEPIDCFEGQYRFLSNFWYAEVNLRGERYATVEHAYQAAKTNDDDLRVPFQVGANLTLGPGMAKRTGQRLKLRPDWEEIKQDIMLKLLRRKFSPVYSAALETLLEATHPRELIEGNGWGDTYWGVCQGKGENHLGKLLMQVRAENRGDIARPLRRIDVS